MTQLLYRDDAYLRETSATIVSADAEGVVLDRTVFYASSGGQPGDTGVLVTAEGATIPVLGAVHPEGDKTRVLHLVSDHALDVGAQVSLRLDWERRHRLMRMHTALHLLSVVFPFPVTGGSVGEAKGRLDFDMPEIPENLPALEDQINAWILEDLPVGLEWITDAQMEAQPELVKTMKVKPPMGQGKVRLVRIGEIDLQPCGGTHVASTGEIGPVRIGKIEKKGRENRRVNLFLA